MRALRAALALTWILAGAASSQVRPPPTGGSAALELALRRLGNTATVMITNAHPDDEDNALVAMLAHGLGVRVVEATATRGEGGQNDLGPELGLALSVIRTEELLATHRIDGAEQVFARAIDFGYSFSVEETFEKWGKNEILADYVRLIRMIRPDVVISMSPDGGGGGQHHQASARITREAFDAAADPARFPDQIAEGLRPWQAGRLYVPLSAPRAPDADMESRPAESRPESAPATRPGDVEIDTDVFDAALGATYAEIGALARGMHKTQGMARLGALPGPAVRRFRLAAGFPGSTGPDRTFGLERFRHPGSTVAASLEVARQALALEGAAAAVAPLVAALAGIRAGRESSARLAGGSDLGVMVEERFRRLEADCVRAIAIAAGLRIEAIADDGLVTPGQEVRLTVYVANRAGDGFSFDRVTFEGFESAEGGCATRPSGPIARAGLVKCESRLRIPKDARFTTAHWKPVPGTARNEFDPDVPFGAPFRPTPFRATVHLSHGGVPLTFEVPVEYRDGSDALAGEKRHEILVVPPGGAGVAVARLEYGHTQRRHIVPAPERPSALPTLDLGLPLAVGWVPSISDRVDDAIRRLGADVVPLDEADLRGDLRRHPVIVVASRALELSDEVRRAARGLVTYAEGGGTVIVLYQRSGLTESTAAPFPAKTGSSRTTDESSPVKLLVPEHPVFTSPNRIGADDWAGWVSERGRSYLETKDPRYVDLIETEDPYEFNKGPKRGVLVEARVGKGRWIYVGLSLSRQLEDGVPGAYRLLANLLSLKGE